VPLHPCPECKREVSTQAVSCPGCGHPLQTPSTRLREDHRSERTEPQQPSRSDNRAKGCLTVLGLAFGILLLGIFVVPRLPRTAPNNATSAQTSEAVPPEQRDPDCTYSGDGVLAYCRRPPAERGEDATAPGATAVETQSPPPEERDPDCTYSKDGVLAYCRDPKKPPPREVPAIARGGWRDETAPGAQCVVAYGKMTSAAERAAAVSAFDPCGAADALEEAVNWGGSAQVYCEGSKRDTVKTRLSQFTALLASYTLRCGH
jgi:hypothetical protein